jgi:hypothetical protein
MTEIPTTEPTIITQGERAEWTKTLGDHPSSEYTLEYRFQGPSAGFSIPATANSNGLSFDMAIPKTTTVAATMAAGKWLWQAWATEIGATANVKLVDSGSFIMKAGFVTGATSILNTSTENETVLAALKAAITRRASKIQAEYEINTPAGTTKIKYMSMEELIDAKNHYQILVNQETTRESVGNGGPFLRQVKVRISDD